MSALEVIAGVLMAVGPPLAYADQVHAQLLFDPIPLEPAPNRAFSRSLACNASLPRLHRWQYVSICKKHDSRGFSTDVTGILIIANITRLFYWIGARFQTYLLVQSILMIVTQYGLLYVCVLYRPANWRATLPPRPGNFWQWAAFGTFLEATAILIVGHAVLFLILHKVDLYVQILGFVALGLEATVRFVCKSGAPPPFRNADRAS